MIRRSKQEKIFYYTMPELYRRKIRELEKCEEKVCWLLNKHPQTRNSDKLLVFYFWQFNDSYNGQLDNDIIKSLTPLESITRARRFLQNELGLFPPTDPDIIEARDISQNAVKQWVIMSKKGSYLNV